ncbi:hypothetical protein [Arthrobacter celericrescens]|uniref:hypothetical protein n=1 Tax=Arthrobacter celericrescens TaxID=2320851 RepID=UPI001FDFE827|nr:hypothetical protein [Arthrobacter celericrescens]
MGVHLVGGVIGTLLIGLFATESAPNKTAGLFYGGGFTLLGTQALATAAVLAYSFAVTWICAKIVQFTVGLRIDEQDELRSIDIAAHAEEAHVIDEEPRAARFALEDANVSRESRRRAPVSGRTRRPDTGARRPDLPKPATP